MQNIPKQDNLESIAVKMAGSLELDEVLTAITQGVVEELDVAFARIWLLGPGDLCGICFKADFCSNRQQCLHLKASSGMYTSTDGEYRRIPLGAMKIGSIALGGGPISTNDVEGDDRLPNKAWLSDNKLQSFAGHPLIFRGQLLGVVAMFGRRKLTKTEFDRIAVFANQAAVAIKNAQLFETLKASETENKSIIEGVPNPLLITRKSDGKILYVNNQFIAMFGHSAEKWLGQKAADLYYDPSDRHILMDEISRSRCIHDYEIRVKRIDGSPLWVSASLSMMTFRNEKSLLTVLNDITDRKQTELALSELQTRNELILNSAGEGIYGLDIDGNTTFVNPSAAQILGWQPGDLLGKSQHDLIHHSYPDGSTYAKEACPIYAAIKDGKVHHVTDEVFWRKDGTCMPVEYTSTPIRDDDNNLIGAVVTFRDITKRKKAEKALHDALTEVQQLKDRLQAENVYLQEEIKLEHNFDEIISISDLFKKVLSQVEQVASTDATVLILGETGTGKELIARALHTISKRKHRPLVKVNCAALPAQLIESELFGHEKGAFTGALARKQGRFELADQGTIFLDEIGDLPLDLQAKLLRVMQEGEFERLGGTQSLNVDVRVIAATNRDLGQATQAGEFRQDLFYRLNVFPINLPPLRDRPEDIPVLVNHFIKKYATKLGRSVSQVPQKVLQALQTYHFPGNVRELENIVERALILAKGNSIQLNESLDLLQQSSPVMSIANPVTLAEIERNHIRSVLESTNWRIEGPKGAALRLGINPNTLRSRMQKLGIKKS